MSHEKSKVRKFIGASLVRAQHRPMLETFGFEAAKTNLKSRSISLFNECTPLNRNMLDARHKLQNFFGGSPLTKNTSAPSSVDAILLSLLDSRDDTISVSVNFTELQYWSSVGAWPIPENTRTVALLFSDYSCDGSHNSWQIFSHRTYN